MTLDVVVGAAVQECYQFVGLARSGCIWIADMYIILNTQISKSSMGVTGNLCDWMVSMSFTDSTASPVQCEHK